MLQTFGRACCDPRREIRQTSLMLLQRGMLMTELQTMGATEWEMCFDRVLFPVVSGLLDAQLYRLDRAGVEELRMRSAALLCKMFLLHMALLLQLESFPQLWLRILDYMQKYLEADPGDLVAEAIPESLKNMLLVMATSGILVDPRDARASPPEHMHVELWDLTWTVVGRFMPGIRAEIFPQQP